MSKDAILTARIDPEVKEESKRIIESYGLTQSQVIRMFLQKLVTNPEEVTPWLLKKPSAETARVLDEVAQGKGLTQYPDLQTAFSELGINGQP